MPDLLPMTDDHVLSARLSFFLLKAASQATFIPVSDDLFPLASWNLFTIRLFQRRDALS